MRVSPPSSATTDEKRLKLSEPGDGDVVAAEMGCYVSRRLSENELELQEPLGVSGQEPRWLMVDEALEMVEPQLL